MPNRKRKPSYLLHRPTDQARVRIGGRDHYLGKYGSPESRERYDDLIAEWFAKGDVSNYRLTVDDLAILFLERAESYYRKDGEPTSEVYSIRLALRPLLAMFGPTRVRDFGPRKLKVVRQFLIDAGHCRTNFNRLADRIKRMFRWGVENEHVPAAVHTALTAVAGLRAGRSEARESEPVTPVEEGTVSDTLPHLTQAVAAMVRLQLLTGARPGEVCAMRPGDITLQTDGVWCYRPASHKTQHRGRERRIYIGSEGQAVLRPFLNRDPEAFCFSPAESEAERNAQRKLDRQTPITPSQAQRKPKSNRKRPPKARYTKDSYRRAVVRACQKAGVPSWSPNRLRHSRATIIRERYGIEAAQTVLGHTDPKTTQIYAERDFMLAARIMKEIG